MNSAIRNTIEGTFIPNLVSVIVPCYNRERLVVRTLDTVRAQHYRPLELLIVDDGSTDNTLAEVRRWSATLLGEENISVQIVEKKNGGAASARNAGLLRSTGEFIQYLDSDDVIDPEKIVAQVTAMQKSGYDFLWSPMTVQKVHLHCDGEIEKKGTEEIYFDDPQSFPDQACVGIYRRSLVARAGLWNEILPTREDIEYRYRIEENSRSAGHLPTPYYHAIEHQLGRENDKYVGSVDIASYLTLLDEVLARRAMPTVMRSISGRYRENGERAMMAGNTLLAIRACHGEIASSSSRLARLRAGVILAGLKLLGATAVHTILAVLRTRR